MKLDATKPSREYLPIASTLLVQPFLAAATGFLEHQHPRATYRATIHRVMGDSDGHYFQQLCDYMGKLGSGGKGRILSSGSGIIGAAFASKHIWRTKDFESEALLEAQLLKEGVSEFLCKRDFV